MYKRKLLITAATFLSAITLQAQAQMMGAQVHATHNTGYGLYVVRMKPSSEPGVISSFFLFNSAKLWPKSWLEIDLEFTPGYTTYNDHANRYVLDNTKPDTNNTCYDPTGNYGINNSNFFTSQCNIESTSDGKIKIATYSGNINHALSFNTYGNSPLVINQSSTPGQGPIIQDPGNHQVFYRPNANKNPFANFYDYYIWYTPTGIYWSAPASEEKYPFPSPNKAINPAALPKPVFAKLWNSNNTSVQGQPIPAPRFAIPEGTKFNTPAQKLAMAYHAENFTPLNAKANTLLNNGQQLTMMINIWDGSKTAGDSNTESWGGHTAPTYATSSAYQKIAYFPLASVTPVKKAAHPGPDDYQYLSASQYSDFTTSQGTFLLNGNPATFNQLWAIDDGSGGFPLGVQSGFSVFCSPKYSLKPSVEPAPDMSTPGLYLQLRQNNDYALPSISGEAQKNNSYTNCSWTDTNNL